MTRLPFWFTAGCFALAAMCGCASLPTATVKPYSPPTATVSADAPTIFSAVDAYVRRSRWELVAEDRLRGLVVARAPVTEPVDGTEEREVWTFRIADGELTASRRLEMRAVGTERWESSDVVCAEYTYSAEGLRTEEILAARRLRAPEPMALARGDDVAP